MQGVSAFLTIASNNYLPRVRTMIKSARCYHANAKFFCVVVDADLGPASAYSAEFETIPLSALALPLGQEFLFQYNILELNTAAKPWALAHLLELGYSAVAYVDPDVYFTAPLSEVGRLFASGAEIILTPHLLAPIATDQLPSELDIRRSGTYNLGFCAIRNTSNCLAFLAWWQTKLIRDCIVAHDRGLFVDQSWIDLVPGMFHDVAILRDPGYNVAYWNLPQRMVTVGESGQYEVDGYPLVFFHFSGHELGQIDVLSRLQTALKLSHFPVVRALAKKYQADVSDNRLPTPKRLDYAYGHFSNGAPIPDIFRKLYRRSAALREQMGASPFEAADVCAERYPDIAMDGVSPTYAMMSLWYAHPSLQSAFPLNNRDSILQFYHWMVDDSSASSIFSTSTLLTHRKLLALLNTEAIASNPASSGYPTGSRRTISMFRTILRRFPDAEALALYAPLCEKNGSTLDIWWQIVGCVESRRHPWRRLRMLTSLIALAMGELRQRFLGSKDSKAMPARPTPVRGLFNFEPDSSTEGVWASAVVDFNVTLRPEEAVTICGSYFPELIAKQSGEITSVLSVFIDDIEFGRRNLCEAGEFSWQLITPPHIKSGFSLLSIRSNKYFVPADVSGSEDRRKLSWRLLMVKIGETPAFHTGAETVNSVPPLANS